MDMQYKKLITLALCVLLSGCALTPEYQRPVLPVAESFADRYLSGVPGSAADRQVENVADLGWRDLFADPLLQQLIETALRNNRDLRETALNVASFQAQYRIQRAAQLPEITASGFGSKQRTLSGTGYATAETYALEVGITSYELDFFGRIKNLKDQALEQYLALEETHKSAAISLVAEVARAYFSWLADRELLQIAKETLQVEEESHTLVQQRVDAGIANELELAQARTSLESVRASLAMYQRQLAQDFHFLNLLVGTEQPEKELADALMLSQVEAVTVIPTTLSSRVLLQRPDIIAAEHELLGANANIGAARAAFFPTFSLTASAGVISSDLTDLFDGGSGSWLFSPTVSIPVFTAGKLEAELDVAKIRKEIFVTRYENAIQNAFREVADALAAVDTYDRQLLAQQANLEANEQYYSLAGSRYREGVDSFLTLLDAQRSLYSSRQQYLTLKLARLQNQVNLYKVLGGGWKEFTE